MHTPPKVVGDFPDGCGGKSFLGPIAANGWVAETASEICQSCRNLSGRKFVLSDLRGPSDIHRNNIIPTGADRVLVESDISYAQSEISLLDKEINRLQQSLDILKNRRDALKQFEIQERGLFSPIRKLPAELLRQIFHQPHLYPKRISACYNPCEFIYFEDKAYFRSLRILLHRYI
ncbi:hypothetical protein BDQ17DRAFT_1436870 [Cyathus striatus]|nr:hypothetical protein BDQ17DRAFT_1436870 [Cyathus striatus]